MADLKTSRVNLRVTESEDRLFREASGMAEESLSEFMVESARERAERLLADKTHFSVDADEWDAFVAALDRPGERRPELVELFSCPRPE
ncbi:MAG: DUF1778 domain-containing protein [Solirubrobacterales bacterium]